MMPIVVVDAKALTYARYVGKILTDKIEVAEELTIQWIEEFRLDPVAFQAKFHVEEAEPEASPGPQAA